jgi:hypothetical protein
MAGVRRGFENGYVPTKIIFRQVDRYLKPLELQYHADALACTGSHADAGPSPRNQLFTRAGLDPDTNARRLWGFRNRRIGTQMEVFGFCSKLITVNGKRVKDPDTPKVKTCVAAWIPFDDADRLFLAMGLDWNKNNNLKHVYRKVNLGCVECGEYQCDCEEGHGC